MTIIANVFPTLRTPKNVVGEMSKKCRFTLPFNRQHGKGAQTPLKSERRDLYHIYWSLQRQMSLKESLLVIWKILRLFFNTFTADDKYSLLSRENLMQPIQMQLLQKQEAFSELFATFSKSRLKFRTFSKKKMTLIANVVPKLRIPKNVVREMCKNGCFTVPFNKQHGKHAQTLLKSERWRLYHIHWWLWR